MSLDKHSESEHALLLSPELMDERVKLLQQQLQQHGLDELSRHTYWLDSTTSTNDMAKSLQQHCALIISNRQTAGRGQAGREWQSPAGNLYLSLRYNLQHPVSGRLALEVALSLVNLPVLQHQPGLQIKWPNDLYFNGAKWGGILIEPIPDSHHLNQVVIGIGLNLSSMQQYVYDQAVTDLGQIVDSLPDHTTLILQTTQALLNACQHFEHGSIDLPTRFAAFDALFNQKIKVCVSGQPDISGIMLGIQADGALLLDSDAGTRVIYSGQVRSL